MQRLAVLAAARASKTSARAAGSFEPAGGGIVTGWNVTFARPGLQRGGHEVVVVDAGELEVALVRRLLRRSSAGSDALLPSAIETMPFGLAARSGRLADGCRRAPVPTRSPASARDRPACTVARKRDDVGRGLELELLDGVQAGAVAVLEAQIDRRAMTAPAGAPLDRVTARRSASRSPRRRRRAARTAAADRGQLVVDELLRLPC